MSTDLQESDAFQPSQSGASSETNEAFFDSLIGQSIGNFHIEGRLGAGAMAAIYRATDQSTQEAVALKILSAAADDVVRARFSMEARTVRALKHPHIVQVLDSGQTAQSMPYIVMQLIEGADLGTFLEKRHQLSVLDSCRILEPIAQALAYAHEAGVIHRDVKPGNILLQYVPVDTPNSIQLSDMDVAVIPLLSDFGIARALDAPELTTMGRTIGTPAYMSPEQCAGNRLLDGRADIYSLGTVLYRCLIGRAPFVGATTQILHAHVYESILIPESLSKALPASMTVILQKALQKDPDTRYAGADMMAIDLGHMIKEIAPVDATLTMPSLPIVPSPAEQPTHVLVAGVGDRVNESTPRTAFPPIAVRGTNSSIRPPTSRFPRAVSTGRRSPRQANWAVILLGIILSAGIGLVFFSALINLMQDFGLSLGGQPTSIVSDVVVADSTSVGSITDDAGGTLSVDGNLPPSLATPQETLSAPAALTNSLADTTTSPTVLAPIVQPSPNLPASTTFTRSVTAMPGLGLNPSVTATVSAPSVTSTVTAVNPIDMAATWEDVKYYYQNGDWGEARWNMITLLSAQYGIPGLAQSNISPVQQAREIHDELLDEPAARYWRQWLDLFTIDEVSQILADIYVGLANENIAGTETLQGPESVVVPPGQTEDYLLAAVTILPNDDELRQLSSALSRYFLADETERTTHDATLSAAYVAYAAARDNDEAYCASSQAVDAAQSLLGEQIPAELSRAYGTACRRIHNATTPTPVPAPLVGTLYYSSESNDGYAIWRVPVGNPAGATLIINQGTQPSLYGNRMAFYNRQTGSEGLSGVALDETNVWPNGPFTRYTNAVEDAKESPAKWNPGGNALVFSSADGGDGKPRLYIAPAAFDSAKQPISLGQDPVWSPDGTQILYHDRGEDGNSPGLFLRPAGGGEASRLTESEDRRPIWTSDGKYIIFMRLVDGSNWELFRMTVADQTTVRLTNHPAQDGLPAINPANNTVLFASDRGGTWNLWTISLFASEYVAEDSARFNVTHGQAEFLMPIQGAFLNWLEHSIQWVN